MTDIFYRVVPLPEGVHSLCKKSPDGSYTILINMHDPDYTWLHHYEHEIIHIKHLDFEAGDIQQIEAEAHRRSL